MPRPFNRPLRAWAKPPRPLRPLKNVTVRPARLSDLDNLVLIEERCFNTDRLSRRSLRRFLTASSAKCLLAVVDGRPAGYALVMFPADVSHARLYSFAVAREARGQGVGRRLLQRAEQAALAGGRGALKLEVRPDNRPAIALYAAGGYREVRRIARYYEDGAPAIRMEKVLARPTPPAGRFPHYAQTLDFTCGPAALLMAMGALKTGTDASRREELHLWRESTLIFMTSGHGGCDPFGLALAAHRRGFAAEVFVNQAEDLFLESVRRTDKREVMRLVQNDFRRELERARIPVRGRPLRLSELGQLLDRGSVPLVLVSGYRVYKQKIPHWVVVTGHDRHYVYLHDPFVRRRAGLSERDSMHLPVTWQEFERMRRYGKARLQAAVMISLPRAKRRKADA
jgi:ribosomal protein S18 acetylase RimI-like enzyme